MSLVILVKNRGVSCVKGRRRVLVGLEREWAL